MIVSEAAAPVVAAAAAAAVEWEACRSLEADSVRRWQQREQKYRAADVAEMVIQRVL